MTAKGTGAAVRGTAPILLVDDRPENLLSLEGVLEPLGQPLVRATSGQEALRHLLAGDFAAILLDVNMPGMDGYETARFIKQRPRSAHVPIIFLTAAERTSAIDLYKLGAVDFLQKPFAPEVLLAKVSVFVELFLRGERLRVQEIELLRQAARQSENERARFAELFLGVVGHDLRSPLSAMMATMQLVARKAKDDDCKHLSERALMSGRRMSRMIDQLLDLTRVRMGGGLHLSRVDTDLVRLTRGVIDELKVAHPGRSVELEAEDSLIGSWDPDRLEQIVQNLVGNAITHGAKDRAVSVRIEAPDDLAILSVENFGAPIPYELRTSLFDPFRRGSAQQATPANGGLGLGLYIAQQVASAHGGRVLVDSDADKTCFRVELPRHKASSPG